MEKEIKMMEEKLEKAPKILGTMLDYLGLEASVKSEEKNGNISLTVFSEDAGRIIGRKGMALQSLQLLLNRIISKGDRDCPRIFIDVDGYKKPERGRRRDSRDGKNDNRRGGGDSRRDNGPRRDINPEQEEQIKQKALDTAKEVKRWGEPVTLPPMNGRDRRIIHVTLEEDQEITTESIESSNDRLKSIVVSLKQ